MRILLTTDPIGGVWTFTREMAQQLLEMGHAVAIVSFGRGLSSSQRAWSEQIATQYGKSFLFRASPTPLEWMQNNHDAFSAGVNLLLQTARCFRADLLHANQFCWGGVPCDLPRIVTAHSDVLSWASSCRPEGLESSAWLRHYCALVQRGIDGADIVVAPTAWMRRALNAHFTVACEFAVIHNGRTIPPAKIVPKRRMQAVCVGRLWDEAKGLKTLFGLELPFPVLVAGEVSFDQATVSTDLLHALGQLEEARLLDLFRASSIYLATSVYEPFGLAPLEAALCGCAVVARDIPSLREVWGSAALFYNTEEELGALLRRLAKSPEILKCARRQAHRRASELNARRMTREYIALYESLVVSGNRTSASNWETSRNAA